jgi:multiple sugar transport system substrate-binding protein
MDERRTRTPDRDAEISTLVRQLAAGRITRRRFARRAPALGLSVPAVAALLGAAGSAVRAARQEGTPVVIGEELDLANLSPEIPDPSEPTKITFASWVTVDAPTMEALRADFQALHPTITVEFQDVPAEEFANRLTTQVAAGNPPDVAYLDAGDVIDFASRNALVDLTPYIEKSVAVKPEDYVDAFVEAATWEGKLYGLPIDGESTGLFYRTDLFEAAGIAAPPTTWEEFEETAAALTQTEGDQKQYGFIIFANEAAYYWYPWLWQNGGEILSEDGTEIRFNSPEGKEAAEFYIGLARYSPPDFFPSNSWDGRVAFANGQVGMYMAGAWFAGQLLSEFPDANGTWATAPLPTRKRCATTIAGDILVLPAGAKHHDAAWKWAEFLSAPQNMIRWTLGTPEDPTTLLPTRTSLLEDPRVFEVHPILKGFAEQMECGVTGAAPNPNYGEVETILSDALARAVYGEIDAATALDEAAAEGQEVLNQ